ncbi:class I SAM-dependent rRNA methyltransferase [Desulfuromonas acetexigens]|uniref:Class I SAM-dependent rRNA methyltransferase n=1 Tax=Trichloromonas acetexigens TaxID=38815 RepID=A0A550JAR5_9BACT|nr:class I SAM-dependent rRNA methyltransferase [Desulfuromonas acetexigens]TRO80338.1 class I SAM-dependent rRNA methyltransferase [Desulfuromonas acetexigens]
MNQGAFVVGPETQRMLELGHPWVIEDRYTKRWPQGSRGDLVALRDEENRLLATALLDPGERVVARVLDFGPMKLTQEWLRQRVAEAWRLRRQVIDLQETTAYRLINGEGDGLPGLTVDRYGDFLLVQLYAESWRRHLPLVAQVLEQEFQPLGIYEKRRPQNTRELQGAIPGKKYSRLLAGQGREGRFSVLENGLNFLVDLEEGLHVGLFLDQRENRRDLMKRVAGKAVLNLFAYTGAFSVAAACAGAGRVTSVDTSAPYLNWAEENFAANRLNPRRHEFIVDDCLEALRALRQQGRRFDVVLMDPPSFSTTKKSRFTTRGGTSDLVAAVLPVLEPGGLLLASSNHQKVDIADYLKELRRGALQEGQGLRVTRIAGQGEDFPFSTSFPEGRYLKYVAAVPTAGRF